MIRTGLRTSARQLVLSLTAALVVAAPASAAEVARIEGASLDARDDARSGFCLRVSRGGPLGGGSGVCGRAPWRPRRSMLATMTDGDRLVLGGAVPAAITRAEAELADGRRVAFDTVAGPGYRGRLAGRLRFFLASVPVTDRGDEEASGLVAVRHFDADGTLQGIEAGSHSGRRLGASRRLLRVRRRGASIVVTGAVQRRLAPTPLALDRFEDLTCLLVRTRRGFGGGGTTACREPGPRRPQLEVYPEAGCAPLPSVLVGFVGDRVSALRLRLGSGRTRRVSVRTMAGAGGATHRYVAAALPRGEAVRDVTAVGTGARLELGEAPGGLPCVTRDGAFAVGLGAGYGGDGAALPPAPDQQVAAEAHGHRLLVRDAEADRLCAGIDRLLADGSDCRLPPATAEDAFALADSGMVSAVLPAEVARVLSADGGEVPLVEDGYDGRYAGAVRFLLAPEATGDMRMLDSAGRLIAKLPVFSPEPAPPQAGPVRLAAGRGWRLTAGRHEASSCLSLSLAGDEEGCETSPGAGDGAFAAVGCAPRVAVLYGTLDRRTRRVTATLRSGRRVTPRIVRVPRRIGRDRVFVLALPRGAEVRALHFDRRRVTFPLLPAARQCGYRVFAPFLSPPVFR